MFFKRAGGLMPFYPLHVPRAQIWRYKLLAHPHKTSVQLTRNA
jgi:hypothetical protein